MKSAPFSDLRTLCTIKTYSKMNHLKHFFLVLIFLVHQSGYTQISESKNSLDNTESYYVPALNGTKLAVDLSRHGAELAWG